MWSNCDPKFCYVNLNWDSNLNLFIKSIDCCLSFLQLVSSNMLILKKIKIMSGLSFEDF